MKWWKIALLLGLIACNSSGKDDSQGVKADSVKAPNARKVVVPEENTITGVNAFQDAWEGKLKPGDNLLRLRPEAGKAFVLKQTFQSVIKKGGPMGTLEMKNQRMCEWQFKSLPASDGNLPFAVNFIRIYNHLTGLPDQALIYKSDSLPPGNPPFEMFFYMKMRKRFFSVMLDPMGACLGVSGMDSVMQATDKNITGNARPGEKPADPMMVVKNGDKPTAELVGGLFSYLPDAPVKPGSVWEGVFISFSPLRYRIEGKYKLNKLLPDGSYDISFSGDAKPFHDYVQEYYGTAGDLEITGKIQANMIVDGKTGFIRSGRVEEKSGGDFNMNGKKFPVSIQCTTDLLGEFRDFMHPDSVKGKL